MRLLELELIAFGPFSGARLDLSGGEQGLHVVHGGNAMGKSTALRALVDALYGIPERTSDDHVHAMRDLRVGLRLRHSSGRELAFVRRKGRKQTLRDCEDRPLPDDALAPFLDGVPRARFLATAGLDHARLVEGGRALVEGGGDLAELLVDAGLGGARVLRLVERLARSADERFTPQASTRPINQQLSAYRAARARAAELALAPEAFAELERARQTCAARLAELGERRQGLEQRRRAVERRRSLVPSVAAWRRVSAELDTLGPGPELAEDFAARRAAAVERREAAARALGRAEVALAEAERALAEAVPEAALIEAAPSIEALHRRLGAVEEAAVLVPQRALELQRLATELGEALRTADRLPPEGGVEAWAVAGLAARPDPLELEAIERLSDEAGRLAASAEALARRRAEAEARLARAGEARDAEPATLDAAALTALVERWARLGDVEQAREQHEAEGSRLEQRVEQIRHALGLQHGARGRVRALSIPESAVVDEFEQALDAEERRGEAARGRATEAGAEAVALAAELEALEQAGPVPSEAELGRARSARAAAWTELRAAIEAGRGIEARLQTHEAAAQVADLVADRLRVDAARVARRAELEARRLELEGRRAAALARAEAAESERERLVTRWSALWLESGLSPRPPREMRRWRERYEALLRDLDALEEARRESRRLAARIQRGRGDLLRALAAVGETVDPETSLGALLDVARARIEAIGAAGERRRLAEAERVAALGAGELARRDAEALERDRAEWSERWASALARGGGASEAPPIARRRLEARGRAARLAERWTELGDEQARQEAGARDVETAASELVRRLRPELADRSAAEQVGALLAASRAAVAEAARRGALEVTRAAAADQRRREARALDEAEATIAGLLAEAGVSEVAVLPELEARSTARRRRREERRAIEAQLDALGGGRPPAELVAALSSEDLDRLEGEHDAIARELEAIDEERASLEGRLGALRTERARMDGRAEAAEAEQEAESAAAALQAEVARYVPARLAAVVLRRHMERFREAHQGPILGRAGAWFARMTGGEFVGLDTELGAHDRPRVVGVRSSGARVEASGMSDGTADQLYLALRLAALVHPLDAGGQEPLPLVLDDVLMTFDERRARAALEILGELSDRVQIVLFTHHAHLVELARSAAGSRCRTPVLARGVS